MPVGLIRNRYISTSDIITAVGTEGECSNTRQRKDLMANTSILRGDAAPKDPLSHQHGDDDAHAVASVFASPDLLLNILRLLIDDVFLSCLSSLALVSKSFSQATQSEQFWREMCHQRWKSKWGFHPRWERAMEDYSKGLLENQQCPQNKSKRLDNFWKARYFFVEQDATRTIILAEELETLVFDFRFWIGQPTVIDGRIVVKSGLLESASREVRFAEATRREERSEEEHFSEVRWTVKGQVAGHPCRESGMEWLLDERNATLQWGFPPNMWPHGSVRRLQTWGWQIQNPNVVMRSIDPTPPTTKQSDDMSSCEWDDAKVDEIERECSKYGTVVNNELWRDLLDSLVNIPLRSAPYVNGLPVTADIPREILPQYE